VTSAPPRSVDEYIDRAPEAARPLLRQLRETIRTAAPEAEERLSYGMPYYHHRGRLAYFSAHAHHVGLYPFAAAAAAAVGLQEHVAGKATLHFPLDRALPAAAIHRLIQQRARANEEKR
jgi:uncharacterized protein YdhG (YjbR/CyaY superfamily)